MEPPAWRQVIKIQSLVLESELACPKDEHLQHSGVPASRHSRLPQHQPGISQLDPPSWTCPKSLSATHPDHAPPLFPPANTPATLNPLNRLPAPAAPAFPLLAKLPKLELLPDDFALAVGEEGEEWL